MQLDLTADLQVRFIPMCMDQCKELLTENNSGTAYICEYLETDLLSISACKRRHIPSSITFISPKSRTHSRARARQEQVVDGKMISNTKD
jgi:hypothetical protein